MVIFKVMQLHIVFLAQNVVIVPKKKKHWKKQSRHGIGGLTAATKLICDRCGAEIHPKSSVTYVGIRLLKMEIYDNDYELCVSCAHKLSAWLSGKENDDD